MCFAANLKKNLFTPWQLCYHLTVTMETRGPDNKLQSYFLKIVRESFWQLGIYDATVAGYVADVLAEFARSDALYKFRGRAGRKEDSVVEMLARQPAAGAAESDVLKERSLRKYVGDYALFMSGIFASTSREAARSITISRKAVDPTGLSPSSTSRSTVRGTFSTRNFRRSSNIIPVRSITRARLILRRLPEKIHLPDSCVKSKAGSRSISRKTSLPLPSETRARSSFYSSSDARS